MLVRTRKEKCFALGDHPVSKRKKKKKIKKLKIIFRKRVVRFEIKEEKSVKIL